MEQITPVKLRYDGADVDAGIIPVDFMVDALVGFSGAYAKVARRFGSPSTTHRLRVVGIEKGSTNILVDAVDWVVKNPEAAAVFSSLAIASISGSFVFIKYIVESIRAKKHLAGKPAADNFIFNGPVIVLTNESGDSLPISKETFELLHAGDLDADLDRITAPLEEGRVDDFELKSGDEVLVRVDAKERPYFIHTTTAVTKTKEKIWMEGFLNSHSKRSNRGTFYTVDGKHIPYHYISRNIQPLLQGYAYPGVVRVFCSVKFDAALNPVSMNIYDVHLVQKVLFEAEEST